MAESTENFYDPTLYEGLSQEAFNPENEARRDPTFFQSLGASFRQNNELISYLAQEEYTRQALEPKFEKFSTTDYEARAREMGFNGDKDLIDFLNVDSDRQFDALVAQKRREQFDRELLSNAGGYGLVSDLVSGVTNPSTLAAAVVGGPAALGAKTIVGAGGRLAGLGFIESSVSEALLHQSQTERTMEESFYNIGAATAFTGILGGVSNAAIRSAEKRTGRRLGEVFTEFRENMLDQTDEFPDTLSAQTKAFTGLDSASAARNATPMEDLRLIGEGNKFGRAVLGNPVARKLSVVFDLGLSKSRAVRESLYKLTDTNILTTGTERGLARPESAEIIGQMRHGVDAKVIETIENNFLNYRKEVRGSGVPVMNKTQFREEIGKAMHLGDNLDRVDLPAGARPYAEKAMRDIRAQQKRIEEMLQARGLLPENVKPGNAESYMHVRWDANKIEMDSDLWNSKLKSYFAKEFAKERQRLEALARPDMDDALAEEARDKLATQFDERFMDQYISEAIEEVTAKITGPTSNGPRFIVLDRETSPFKGRGFNVEIDEDMVKFMDTDVEHAMKSLSKFAFGRVGLDTAFDGKDLKTVLKEVDDDYAELYKGATPAEKAKLTKEKRRHKESISDLWELNLGTFNTGFNPDSIVARSLMFAKNLNFLRFMGGRVLSSIPDIAMPVLVHGMGDVYGDAIKPLIKAKTSKQLKQALKEAPEEVEDFAVAMEHILNVRNQEVWGVADPLAKGTAMERLVENGAAVMSKYSGANWWDNTMKSVAHITAQNRLLRVAESGIIGTDDIKLFARHGLDADDIKAVGEQFKKHGRNVDGFRVANMNAWDEPALASKVQSSLFRINRSTIFGKGFADAPIVTNSAIGGVMTQFMTHAFASNQRLLVVAAQMGPAKANVVAGMLALTSLGMMVDILKDVEVGREPDLEPGDLVVAGIDRSGIASIPMYLRGIGQKFGVDPLSAAGITAESRYAQFGKLEQILGPTASLYTDTADMMSSVSKAASSDEDFSPSDVRNITTNGPLNVFGTMPGIKTLLSEAKRAIDEEYGK